MSAQTIPLNSLAPQAPARTDSYLSIGGISVRLRGFSPEEFSLGADVDKFTVSPCQPDIDIQVEWWHNLQPSTGENQFDSGAVWKLCREDDHFVFDFYTHIVGDAPYKKMRIDPEFRIGQLLLNRELLAGFEPIIPLEYPADELLITNHLANGLGVELHGCGLVDPEFGGLLLLGHSGAGKSTSTRLWKALRNVTVLSDDRIILRLHGRELWMYGTPWHGEVALASASRARISRIFILAHGPRNSMKPLSPSQSVGELFARSFPPFHRPSALERTIEFLNRIADIVPCYEFNFVPNQTAVEAVINFHD